MMKDNTSSNRFSKAAKKILVDGQFHRIWQIVNKSPLVHVVSAAQNVLHLPTYLKRTKAITNLQLNETQSKIFENLQKTGIAHVHELFTNNEFQVLEDYLNEKLRLAEIAQKNQKINTKDFWLRLSDTDAAEAMTTKHPLVEVSLHEPLLQIIAKYLGQAPFLQYTLLTNSVPSTEPLKSSQLWHHDHDSNNMLKFFIYLSDVNDDDDGPFTLLPRSESEKIENSFFTRHLTDQEVAQYCDMTKIMKMTGKKWSTFICDTSRCYHMGSRLAMGHQRILSTSLYIALPCPFPGVEDREIKVATKLSELQDLAINP